MIPKGRSEVVQRRVEVNMENWSREGKSPSEPIFLMMVLVLEKRLAIRLEAAAHDYAGLLRIHFLIDSLAQSHQEVQAAV